MSFTVKIEFKDSTETRDQYHVKETWTEGPMFCLRAAYRVVHKYPIANIHRVKEIEEPTPGDCPDFNQIREDFGYEDGEIDPIGKSPNKENDMRTYAVNITDITYDLVSAFLPPGFLFVPRYQVIDHSVAVINEFIVIEDAEDGGEVFALQNAWYDLNEFSLYFEFVDGNDFLGPFYQVRRR